MIERMHIGDTMIQAMLLSTEVFCGLDASLIQDQFESFREKKSRSNSGSIMILLVFDPDAKSDTQVSLPKSIHQTSFWRRKYQIHTVVTRHALKFPP